MRKMKIVVYTSITNNHDFLKIQPEFEDDEKLDIEYRAYLDKATTTVLPIHSKWKIYSAVDLFKDPKRNCQMVKVMPFMFMNNDVDFAVWIDGSVILKTSIKQLIKKNTSVGGDIALIKHSQRDCIYKEAWDCKHFKLDDPEVIDNQMEWYKDLGFPEHYGLSETPLIIRRNTADVIRFNIYWWAILCGHSKRDQLSFDFVRWMFNTPIHYINGNIHTNDFFIIDKHLVLREHERK